MKTCIPVCLLLLANSFCHVTSCNGVKDRNNFLLLPNADDGKEVKEMEKEVKEMGKEIKQFRETSSKQLQDMGTSVANDVRVLTGKAQSELQKMGEFVDARLGVMANDVKVMSENANRSLTIIEEQSKGLRKDTKACLDVIHGIISDGAKNMEEHFKGQREDANMHYDLMQGSVNEAVMHVHKIREEFTVEFLPRANNLMDNVNIVMRIGILLLLLLAIFASYCVRSRIGSELFSICGYVMELVLLFCVSQILAKIVYQFVNGEDVDKELSGQIVVGVTVGLVVLIVIAHCRPVINNRFLTENRNPVAQPVE